MFFETWQRIARRIRVPLGFVVALLYLAEMVRHRPQAAPMAWSLLLVIPGLWLRAYAAGYVKKNRELTMTGPYAYVRNPLYLGSILIGAGFAAALESWIFGAVLALFFLLIYVPVIVSEEAFLRGAFPEFAGYCERVPRLIPRLIPSLNPGGSGVSGAIDSRHGPKSGGSGFSFLLYRRHREYNSAVGAALLYGSLLLANLLHALSAR